MAVSSDVIIANLALSAIGTRSTIVSLTETSVEAQTIALHYNNVRDQLLREAPWNFARKQLNLALLNDSTSLSPPVTQTCTFANAATNLTVASTVGIIAGATVTGAGIQSNTTVTTIGSLTVGLSTPTIASETAVVITFTPSTYQPVPMPWVYEYAYPSDCMEFREILPLIPSQQVNQQIFGIPNNGTVNSFGAMNMAPVIRFLVSTDVINGQNQTVVLTNQPQAVGVYTYQCTNSSLFDPSFVYALAGRLASRICIALNGDKALAKLALQESQDLVTQAKARDGNEGITVADRVPDWIRARGFTWSWQYPDGQWEAAGNVGYWGGF